LKTQYHCINNVGMLIVGNKSIVVSTSTLNTKPWCNFQRWIFASAISVYANSRRPRAIIHTTVINKWHHFGTFRIGAAEESEDEREG
jgi:hypothetical protein